jgi:hypothetical protein
MATDPATAADTTLMSVLETFARNGYRGRFRALEGGQVRCETCDTETAAPSLTVSAKHRLEGASDPSDALLVIGATCPACGSGGTLTLGFGPAASARDADVVAGLPIEHRLADPVADQS